MPSRQSSFLDAIPDSMVDKRSTIKVRSSGRSFMRAGGDRMAYGRPFGRGPSRGDHVEETLARPSAAARRPGSPLQSYGGFTAPEDESQDAPILAIGARVKHRKFGTGTIAEMTGSGR